MERPELENLYKTKTRTENPFIDMSQVGSVGQVRPTCNTGHLPRDPLTKPNLGKLGKTTV